MDTVDVKRVILVNEFLITVFMDCDLNHSIFATNSAFGFQTYYHSS